MRRSLPIAAAVLLGLTVPAGSVRAETGFGAPTASGGVSVCALDDVFITPPQGPPDPPGPNQFVVRDADSLVVPIVVNGDLPTLEDWGFEITYDPAVLECEEVRPGPVTETGWGFCCGNCLGTNMVRVGAGLGLNPPANLDPANPDTIAIVIFSIIDADVASTTLMIDNFVDQLGPPNPQFPEALDLAPCSATITFDQRGTGDVDQNGRLTPGDALCAARATDDFDVMPQECIESTPPPPNASNRAPIERYEADVDCSGYVGNNDAQDIFDGYFCAADPVPCLGTGIVCPTPLRRAPLAAAYHGYAKDKALRLGPPLPGEAGAVSIPVEIRGSSHVSAFGLDFEVPAELVVTGFQRSAATSGWMAVDSRTFDEGFVRLGAYDFHGTDLPQVGWLTLGYLEVLAENAETESWRDIRLVGSADDLDGIPQLREGSGAPDRAAPIVGFSLGAARPNPTAGSVSIEFVVPERAGARVRIDVFDVGGRLVSTLVDEVRAPGTYEVIWDGRSSTGREVAAGTYFYRMIAGDTQVTRRVIQTR